MLQQPGSGSLTRYLRPECVIVSQASTQEAVIHDLISAAERAGLLQEPAAFEQAVLGRERIVSTGIGLGMAIPHAKRPELKEFFICCALVPHGVEWKAIDGDPCHLVFLIGGPDDQPNAYLQLLSQLTAFLRDDERRKQLLKSRSANDILTILKRS
ncbi:MAG: PTS sugar transporter subunit IIA [Chlamydiia bacterium]